MGAEQWWLRKVEQEIDWERAEGNFWDDRNGL